MQSRCRAALLLLVGALAFLSPLLLHSDERETPLPQATSTADGPPRLIVLVVFDQLRGDYLQRWRELYGRDGFQRLCTGGAWFTNCHYPYANTVTAAGHASIATGCCPAEHGIVGNEWRDRVSGELVESGFTGRYERVPYRPPAPPKRGGLAKKEKFNVSPELLLAPTIGDALKEATDGKGRVVGLSMKERAAALPAGQHPDACYWFDTDTGMFVTSTYYRNRVHSWVASFNERKPADYWFGRTWQRLWPGLNYASYSGPDEVQGEGIGVKQGQAFPHPLTGGLKRPAPEYYKALLNSPFGNDLLLDLALRALETERLGQRDVPDFLSLSFSCNDVVGHCWGPDSQEVLDVTLRSDLIIKRLLAHLDARVGRGRYVLVMTADHGVCALPEVSRSKGIAAGRLFPDVLTRGADAYLNEKFPSEKGSGRWLNGRSEMWMYLNQRLIQDRGLRAPDVESALAGWLKQQPGILTVYTRSQLLSEPMPYDPFAEAVRKSFYPERCGDVAFILKPYFVLHTPLANGTNHGTPHPYDTHVPLLVYGGGVQAGMRTEAVTPLAAAAILAEAVHIKPPARAQAPAPRGLFLAPAN
jgi:hypothetical protein